MGLHIQTLDAIPADAGRKYFIYLLDYGWQEPLVNTLMQNFTNMARMASESDSVVIAGISPVHFANDVFSWHGINGEDGEAALPAILISTLHPSYFIEHQNGNNGKIRDKLILIPLKKACKTTDDVINLIRSIFKDIKGGSAPMAFSVAKEIRKEESGRFADSLLLEPNFAGVGLKLEWR